MRIEVRLFATLVAFLPPESREGAIVIEVPEGSTVHDVIGRLKIPTDLERVMLVNGADAIPGQSLRSGDVVTVFPPLVGGRR